MNFQFQTTNESIGRKSLAELFPRTSSCQSKESLRSFFTKSINGKIRRKRVKRRNIKRKKEEIKKKMKEKKRKRRRSSSSRIEFKEPFGY